MAGRHRDEGIDSWREPDIPCRLMPSKREMVAELTKDELLAVVNGFDLSVA